MMNIKQNVIIYCFFHFTRNRWWAGTRVNYIFEFVLTLFQALASWPSSIIECFIRKRFGQRAFTISTCFGVFALMIILAIQLGNLIGFAKVLTLYIFAFVYLD